MYHNSNPKTCDLASGEIQLKGPEANGAARITIRYDPATNGDKKVIEKVTYNATDPNTFRIGLCDPLSVVTENYQRKEDAKLLAHEIRAVFIDRISLSLFARVPKNDRKGGTPGERDRHLNRIIKTLEKDEINYPGRFTRDGATDPTVCSFWGAGETTRFIVDHFLRLSGAKYMYEPMPDPDFELTVLRRGDADLGITHAPWSIEENVRSRNVRLFTRECFPCIQFPFSCIVGSVVPKDKRGILDDVLQKLLFEVRAAILLIHDTPWNAITILQHNKEFFRYYGLKDAGYADRTITRALNHFLVTGCFSSDLNPDWTSWLHAFLMDKKWKDRVNSGERLGNSRFNAK